MGKRKNLMRWSCIGAIFALILASAASAFAAASPPLARLEPADGVYIGGGTVDGQWPEFVTNAGKQPALRGTFVYFPSGTFTGRADHPEQSLENMAKDGVTPVVTWQPQTYVRDIAAGKYDDYIRRVALECKQFGRPMFLRFAHESNGYWYDWSKYPDAVVAASQRIYRIFHEAGADNVAFVWCPAFDSSGKKSWLGYYPGDDYVDWVGVDVYNWARWPRTFDAMVKDIYAEYASRKPIMIGEVASAENFTPDPGFTNPDAQNKSKWITDMFGAMNTKYPRIKAFVWFNVVKEDNWKISSSPASLAAFRNGIAGSRYLSKVPASTPTPTATPQPGGYGVNTTHRWASYNGSNKPIEHFTVKPGTTVQQSVYYKNTGTRSDTYTVSVSGIPAGWWRYSPIGAATVAPGDGRYGNVFIMPTTPGTYTFTVEVTSNCDPSVSGSQTYTMYVGGGASVTPTPTVTPQPGGYGVNTTHRWASYNGSNKPIEQFAVKAGTTVQQSVYYKNTGTRSDTYTVSVSGIPASWWRYSLIGNAAVAPGDGRYGNVFITPTTAGNYTFTVKVTSASDPAMASAQTYTLHVK